MDAPFDKFMRAYSESNGVLMFVDGFGRKEWRGFNLFLSKTHCSQCHSGKNFSGPKVSLYGASTSGCSGKSSRPYSTPTDPFHCYGKDPECREDIATLKGEEKAGKNTFITQSRPDRTLLLS